MDLDLAGIMALDEMQAHGLIERGWRFQFDDAPRRFGQCRYSTKTISLSRRLVKMNSSEEVMETILHEIAHALAGHAAGHGPQFVRVAQAIGCTGRRFYGSEVNTPPRRARISISDITGG